jgi:tetratricopeptide (TPR) repeat protein
MSEVPKRGSHLLSRRIGQLTMSKRTVKMEPVTGPEGNPAQETIGERLRRLRFERGLSQRELSEPGVSYAYISRIEGGARRPSVKALRMLARKLGVSADYLETGMEIRDTEGRELQIADAELQLRLATDTADAGQKLERLLQESLTAGDSVAAARASVALGLAAAHAGQSHDAIERLNAGLQLSPLSPSARPDVYATLGRAYDAIGRPSRAVELFEQCLEQLAEESPEDTAARIRFTTYLSYSLTDMGDLERAQAVVSEAVADADELIDAYSRVRLYWSAARLNHVQGRDAVALDYIRRAIALLDATEDTLHLARAHLLAGSIMFTQGRADDARRHYDLAERIYGRNAEPQDLAELYTEQAKIAIHAGDADEAVQKAQAGVEIAGDEFSREKGTALWTLAEAHALAGDDDRSNDAFSKATSLLEQHGHKRDLVEAQRSWGKFLKRVGREEEALEVLERATDLAAETAVAESHGLR